jgi:hypothetical protein
MHRLADAEQLFADLSTMTTTRRIHVVAVIVAALFSWSLDEARADPSIVGPRNLMLAKGPRVAATLFSASAAGGMNFTIEGRPRRVSADELVAWGSPSEPRATVQLLLADGGIVCLANDPRPTTEQDHLMAVSNTFGRFRIPLKKVAGILLHCPIDPQCRDRLATRLDPRTSLRAPATDAAAGNHDRLLLENGDEFHGRVIALVDGAAEFEAELGPLTVELERVTAIAFHPLPGSNSAPAGPRLLVGFADGSVLHAQSIQVTASVTKLNFGAAIQPLAADETPVFIQPVGGAQPVGGTAQYLSDLPVVSYKHIPYLGLPREYRLDANAEGTRLRASGTIYPKGVGMHSAARLTWALKKPYRRFQAELAIDEQTAGRGSVVFRVFSGSREVFKSPTVRGGEPPLPISVDIRDARQLSLVVDYGDRADVLDRADWLNARLVP